MDKIAYHDILDRQISTTSNTKYITLTNWCSKKCHAYTLCYYILEFCQHTFLMEDNRDCKLWMYCWTSVDISPRFWQSMSPVVSSCNFSTLEDKLFLLHKSITFTLSSSNPCTSSSVFSVFWFSISLSCIPRFFSRQSLYSALRNVYLHCNKKDCSRILKTKEAFIGQA